VNILLLNNITDDKKCPAGKHRYELVTANSYIYVYLINLYTRRYRRCNYNSHLSFNGSEKILRSGRKRLTYLASQDPGEHCPTSLLPHPSFPPPLSFTPPCPHPPLPSPHLFISDPPFPGGVRVSELTPR